VAIAAQSQEAAVAIGDVQRAVRSAFAGVGSAAQSASTQAPEQLPAQSAMEERDMKIRELRDSGPDRRNLSFDAEALSSGWQGLADKDNLDLRVGPWQCYAAGCFTNVVHVSSSSVDKLTDLISRSDEFHHWNGAKFRSGNIEQGDGKTEITWIFYAPPDRALSARSGAPPLGH